MAFAEDNWLQSWREVTLLCLTIPDRGGQEVVDSLDKRGHFTFCAPVELNLVTKVFLFLYRTEALLLAKDNWLNLRYDCTVLLMTGPDRGGPEAADCLDIVRHFGFCTPKNFKIKTKVVSDLIELKPWLLPKTIDCKGDKRLHSCVWLSQTVEDRKLLIVLTWEDTSLSALLLSWI